MNLSDVLSDYLDTRDVSAGYKRNLRRSVYLLSEALGKRPTINDLSKSSISVMADFLKAAPYSMATRTINTKLRHIGTIWSHAREEFAAPPIPKKLKRLKEMPLVVDGFTTKQVSSLLSVIDNPRVLAAVWIAWNTGFRLGDVIKLQWFQVTPEGMLTIIQNKTARLLRRKLWKQTLEAMQAIRSGQSVFPPTSKNWLRDRIYEACQKAKVPRGAFKFLRRGSASEAEKISPGAGSKHCGHADPRVFEKYYAVQEICGESSVQPPKPLCT